MSHEGYCLISVAATTTNWEIQHKLVHIETSCQYLAQFQCSSQVPGKKIEKHDLPNFLTREGFYSGRRHRQDNIYLTFRIKEHPTETERNCIHRRVIQPIKSHRRTYLNVKADILAYFGNTKHHRTIYTPSLFPHKNGPANDFIPIMLSPPLVSVHVLLFSGSTLYFVHIRSLQALQIVKFCRPGG